jgi:3-hydroxyisobutyrate dehydrogenase
MNSISGKIGFIGIGAMGTPMAGNLAAAGFKLVIHDADANRTAKFTASHAAEIASNLAALGAACDIVITMLPDGKIVRKVLCGDSDSFKDCVAAGLKQSAIVIDMSSSSPVGTRELGSALAKRGIGLIDAPVSGGVKRAVDASLAIMVGGDAALFERCKPIFGKLGKQIFHAGPLGAGHAVKALNNYVSAAGLVAACEAVVAGSRFGLKPETIIDILNASSGMNNSTQNKFRQFILSRTWGAEFMMGLMAKDLRTALEVCQATGTPTLLAGPCVKIWNSAEEKIGGAADHTEIFRYLDELKSG